MPDDADLPQQATPAGQTRQSTPPEQVGPDGTHPEEAPNTRTPWSRGAAMAALLASGLVGGAIGALTVSSLSPTDERVCRGTVVADRTLPSVVTVLTSGRSGSGNGTGELVRSGGYILTNDHVISSVAGGGGTVAVQYSDGTQSEATIVGRDPSTDLAVLRAGDEGKDRPLIRIGSSESLRIGQPVVALGAPLGLSSTVTTGIVSALGRLVSVPSETGPAAHLVDAIQTDAAINPGNSGGPLVDCGGALVGINTAIAVVPSPEGSAGGGSVGVGFAIPVDLAKPIADQLITSGRAMHPDLGLTARPLVVESDTVPQGLFVTGVAPGGPAEQAGIRAGDVIVAVEGQPAQSVEQLVVKTLTRSVGDTVAVTVWRDGKRSDAKIVLGEPR
ncbi:MAG: trypsin-like peptidase domain-containing protein [Intrasporangium sp.]|uniref:S1C family serine protease n=1 Tax=Intrasporangium sp. TaxID=1925024 RepID=UPI002647DBB1|nr:trypsin-like peptidase domain-containing protein [Intrasporangium sp.]MDN5795907.1 trypsin-like peptidase domain-containing protein [Intrasporangium sp.]